MRTKKKDPTTALLLCLILGGIGAHEFYLSNINKGVISLVFCWTFIPGIISLIQLFTIQKRVMDENDAIAQKILAGIKDQGPIGSIVAGSVAGVEADLSKHQEMRGREPSAKMSINNFARSHWDFKHIITNHIKIPAQYSRSRVQSQI